MAVTRSAGDEISVGVGYQAGEPGWNNGKRNGDDGDIFGDKIRGGGRGLRELWIGDKELLFIKYSVVVIDGLPSSVSEGKEEGWK